MDPGEQPQVRSDLGLRAAAVDSATGGVQTSTLSIIVEVNMMVSGGEVTVSGLDVRVRVSKSLEPGKVEMIVVPLCVGVVAAGRVDVSTIVEVSPGKVTVRVTGMLEPGKVEMYCCSCLRKGRGHGRYSGCLDYRRDYSGQSHGRCL